MVLLVLGLLVIGLTIYTNRPTETYSLPTENADQTLEDVQEYKEGITFSNLVDKDSQAEVRKAMEFAGIAQDNIDSFFEDVDNFNRTVEDTSLVKEGFTTIDSFEPAYDFVAMLDMWDAKNPQFIGYNCRITTYNLLKDTINIGKPDTTNADWMVFDENALENNPKKLFNETEHQNFQTLFASIPAEETTDIHIHLKNVQADWKKKEITFSDKDKKSIISVFFHDFENYLFIGHMGVLIPTEDGKLLFLEKLSFQAPYQAIKFNNRVELNDYLMGKYDNSWGQPTAKPFIMENDQLLEGYRENPNNQKQEPG